MDSWYFLAFPPWFSFPGGCYLAFFSCKQSILPPAPAPFPRPPSLARSRTLHRPPPHHWAPGSGRGAPRRILAPGILRVSGSTLSSGPFWPQTPPRLSRRRGRKAAARLRPLCSREAAGVGGGAENRSGGCGSERWETTGCWKHPDPITP